MLIVVIISKHFISFFFTYCIFENVISYVVDGWARLPFHQILLCQVGSRTCQSKAFETRDLDLTTNTFFLQSLQPLKLWHHQHVLYMSLPTQTTSHLATWHERTLASTCRHPRTAARSTTWLTWHTWMGRNVLCRPCHLHMLHTV